MKRRLQLRPRCRERAAQLTRSWRRRTGASSTASLRYRAVAADSGAIGGDLSEEFQVTAATGEDAIVYVRPATTLPTWKRRGAAAWWPAPGARAADGQDLTPGKSTCAQVAELLGVPLARTVKSIVLATDEVNERRDEIVATRDLAAAAARRPRQPRSRSASQAR